MTTPPGIVFVLSENNLRERGRRRNVFEVCLNVNQARARYLGVDKERFSCITDDGAEFEGKISGRGLKNFRGSRNSREFGAWLKGRCNALPGDEVHAVWIQGSVLLLRYVRKGQRPEADGESLLDRRLERQAEESFCATLVERGVPARRQVPVASGVVDILAPDAIYEVKTHLTRDSILRGVGQLLVYQSDFGEPVGRRLVLVGRETRETGPLLPALGRIGVEVELWPK